jgi:hypothetical protein
MFGNYNATFGLNFPVDSQGGLFGPTAPVPGITPPGPDAGGLTAAPLDPKGSPAAGVGGPAPSPTAPSPLASPMAAGQATQAAVATDQPNPAPAAGVGSPFAAKGGL